jgi:hypothetical protein
MEPAAFVLLRMNSGSSTFRFLQYTNGGQIKETSLVTEILNSALKSSIVYATVTEASLQNRLPPNLVYKEGSTWGVWNNDSFTPQVDVKRAFDEFIQSKYIL